MFGMGKEGNDVETEECAVTKQGGNRTAKVNPSTKIEIEIEVKQEPVDPDEYKEAHWPDADLEPKNEVKVENVYPGEVKDEVDEELYSNYGVQQEMVTVPMPPTAPVEVTTDKSSKVKFPTLSVRSSVTRRKSTRISKTGGNELAIPRPVKEKKIECQLCQRRFTKQAHLVNHTRIHTNGRKMHKCEICNKQFHRKSYLRDHLRIHSGERPFRCKICEKQFTQKVALSQHTQIHTGEKRFSCDVCQMRFNRKANLTGHIRIHSGEKPFSCHICNKQFNRKTNLTYHVRIHSGEKPYQCSVCRKHFTMKAHLIRHEQIHIEMEPLEAEMAYPEVLITETEDP